MLDSPAISSNLAKTLETTRAHKVRKQSEEGEKGDFFKKVQDNLEEKNENEKEDIFYRSDEAEFEHAEGDAKSHNGSDKNSPVNKADKEQPGSMGKSIDIKI